MAASFLDQLGPVTDARALVDELIRRDLPSFVMRGFPYLNGGADLDPNWHLDAICHQLGRIGSGDCQRLIITLPPRNLKSFIVSVAWPAWCLGHDPARNFVHVSYSNELAAKHARDCRALIQSDWYQRLFPRTRLLQSRSAAYDFETTAGGGRLATSITGTLTGRGGDVIVIDDPIKPDDALSDTVREGVNEWFSSTLASRLNDKSRGAIVLVMQRLHQFDLAGMLLERGGWDQLSLAAIATDNERVLLTRGRTHERWPGQALHPSREPLDVLLSIKRTVGSPVFAAQYQQQPVPAEGNMIRAEWLRHYDNLPAQRGRARIVQSWDTATEEGLFNDFSVCITALLVKRTVYVLDVWRRRVDFPRLKRTAIAKAREYEARTVLVEDQSSGRQLIQCLRNEQPDGVPVPLARKPERDKRSRLAGVSAQIEAGQLLLPRQADWLADFTSELLAFPSSRHDDQVDALSQMLIWVDRQQSYGERSIGAPIFVSADGTLSRDLDP